MMPISKVPGAPSPSWRPHLGAQAALCLLPRQWALAAFRREVRLMKMHKTGALPAFPLPASASCASSIALLHSPGLSFFICKMG